MTQIQLIARHSINPGSEQTVYTLLDEFVTAAREEPGNLAFDVYRKIDDEASYVLLERYASREALVTHRDSAHFKDLLLAQIVPHLQSRVIEEYAVAG